ncbi:MAG: CPBP family intramembrane metalloprotease, partial [Acidimicrobiia bacterium]|nr:CPBP family intramembrane metalloprotease [Acidimicrobiia bacterium]
AVWVMVVPYMMIHFTKPPLEALGAVVAGAVLGVLSLRKESIWLGAALHIGVALTMDIAALWQRALL